MRRVREVLQRGVVLDAVQQPGRRQRAHERRVAGDVEDPQRFEGRADLQAECGTRVGQVGEVRAVAQMQQGRDLTASLRNLRIDVGHVRGSAGKPETGGWSRRQGEGEGDDQGRRKS